MLEQVMNTLINPGQVLTPWRIILNLAITVAVAMFIFYIYRRTFSGILYSRSFNITLVMVALITALVMMTIAGNVALSLGLVGALSIVRFRAAIKDPRDIAFLFWSVSVGITAGIGMYGIALIGALAIGLIVYLLSSEPLSEEQSYLLIVYYSEMDQEPLFDIIKKHCSFHQLRILSREMQTNELIVEVRVKAAHENDLLKEINDLVEVERVRLVSYTGELEEPA